jgi:hypothetical protein
LTILAAFEHSAEKSETRQGLEILWYVRRADMTRTRNHRTDRNWEEVSKTASVLKCGSLWGRSEEISLGPRPTRESHGNKVKCMRSDDQAKLVIMPSSKGNQD